MRSLLFYNFFKQLRKSAGIELDLRQYQHFHECLVKRPPAGEPELLNLCKAMWLPRSQYAAEFERLFREALDDLGDEFLQKIYEQKKIIYEKDGPVVILDDAKTARLQKIFDSIDEEKQIDELPQQEPLPAEQIKDELPAKSDWKEVVLNIQEEGDYGAIEQLPAERISAKKIGFIFSDSKHFPFNERKAQHAWRRFRGESILRPAVTPDIPSTIREYAASGVMNNVRYEQEKVSCQEIIWLSDHGGSMTPFEEWDNALFNIVKGHAGIGKLHRYFFYCYPDVKSNEGGKDFEVFKDRGHARAQSLHQLRKSWNKNVLVIIFSEGGAALGRTEDDRLTALSDLHAFIGKKARIIWFNPVSSANEHAAAPDVVTRTKWVGSAAGYLSVLLRMYDLNDLDIQRAIQEV